MLPFFDSVRFVFIALIASCIINVSAQTTTSTRVGESAVVTSAPQVLMVAAKIVPPFVIKNPDGTYGGISIELWERIASALHLKYKYSEMDLDGLVDSVAAGSADVGIGALTMTAERERMFNFTHPYYTAGLGIVIPISDSPGWWLLVKKLFSQEFLSAVLALVVVLLLSGFFVWLFERKRNPEQFGGPIPKGIGAGFWWAAVTMTTVGYGDKAPQTLGGRLVGVVWMFTAVIIISSFTATIASSLTVGQLGNRVNGPEDLSAARVGTTEHSTSATYMDTNGIGYEGFDDIEPALDALRSGRLDAVVYDAPMLKYAIRQNDSGHLKVLPKIFDRQQYALALPNDSALQERINQALLTIVADPAWQRTLKRYVGSVQ